MGQERIKSRNKYYYIGYFIFLFPLHCWELPQLLSSRTLVDSPGDLPHMMAGAGQEGLQAEPAPLRHPGTAVEYEHLQGCASGQQGLKS